MTPRSTTEALVGWAVEWIGSRSVRVADVGTGSGAVAVAVALRAPCARIWATDDSEAAVTLARANVARHGLEERVEVLLGDLLAPVPGRLDLVLANLPYHAAARSRGPAANACREQPEHAIYAPGDGLQFNRDLIDACRTRLQERGALAIQLYGCLLSAGRGELDELLQEIEARAAEGWEARVAADASGRGSRCCAWHAPLGPNPRAETLPRRCPIDREREIEGGGGREGAVVDLRLKRAYDPASSSDGYRVLIDRLWPRGVSKQQAKLDEWEKELAPSTELRQWFGHEPDRFAEFRRRYISELRHQRPRLAELRRRARAGTLTLVYSAHDGEHNDAVVLAEVLRRGLPRSATRR